MEHVYTVHTKIIQDKTYYFVKKILALPEYKGLAEVVVGYGMHTDLEKACSIAGIVDVESIKLLLHEQKESEKPKKVIEKRTIQISDTVNRWLAERGAEVLN